MSGRSESSPGIVKAADSVAARDVVDGTATRMRVLIGPDDGAPNFVLRRFTMEAGGGIPLHRNDVEHEQYVVRGRARMTIGDEVREVGPHDALYIPAGTPHAYEVLEAPFEFLCVVPNAPDRLHFPGREEG